MAALISAGGAAAARRALAKTLVHLYDRTVVTSMTVDGDEVAVLGTPTLGLACRYEAAGQTLRTAEGRVTVSGPSLTVAYEDPLAPGDLVSTIRNAVGESLLLGPLFVLRRLDDDPLGVTLQKLYELHGADPGRAT